MKIVITSDLQSHQWASYPETNEHGINLRLLDTVKELRRLHKLCLKNAAEMFVVLGDIFEARSLLSVPVLNAVYESLYAFQESGIKVVLLVGNHDRTSVGNDHSLKVFKSFATVIERPMTIPIPGGNIVGVPFHPNPEAIARGIAKLVNRHTKLLMLHCAVKSLRMPGGAKWGEGINLSDIPKNTRTLLGHYHRWTELRSGKVWYLGSMIPVDFGDTSIEKFYAVYNTDSKVMRFFPTHGPKFITLYLSLRPEARVQPGETIYPAHLDLESHAQVIDGNYIRIKALPRSFMEFQGLQEVLKSLGARNVSYDFDTILAELSPQAQEETPAEAEVDEWTDQPLHAVVAGLEGYVDTTPHNLDRDKLVETGVSILTTVQPQDTESSPEAPLQEELSLSVEGSPPGEETTLQEVYSPQAEAYVLEETPRQEDLPFPVKESLREETPTTQENAQPTAEVIPPVEDTSVDPYLGEEFDYSDMDLLDDDPELPGPPRPRRGRPPKVRPESPDDTALYGDLEDDPLAVL